ncbi:P2Y purinoceptor 6-like [Spea bombifrons]|uniref:P2Y purinoceptor 6-like n=1 Tax=Spea bombifrons TaxID=233779 RepID=UPI00234B016B|nr:P2Y purinoceptor 6-like [Spea bombifrons]
MPFSPAPSSPNSSITPTSSSGSPCQLDESYKHIFLPTCYSFTFLLSLALNSIVLTRCIRRPWNPSLVYMFNLALSDLMYGLSLPFLIASYISRDRWIFGDPMCRLVRFLFYFNLYCSIFFLTCISFHRYQGICHPMRSMRQETLRWVRATCLLVWAIVFAMTSPILLFARTGPLDGLEDGVTCWDDALDSDLPRYLPYGIFLHIAGFFLPFTLIAWCYSRVVRTLCRTLRPGAVPGPVPGLAQRRKSIRTIVTITLLFTLCFLPFHVTRTIFMSLRAGGASLGGCRALGVVAVCYKVTRPLASANAWLNALLYFVTKEQWGKGLKIKKGGEQLGKHVVKRRPIKAEEVWGNIYS